MKQTYRIIITKRQEGSLAATSKVVSDDIHKWDAIRVAVEELRSHEVTEITIKKTKDAVLKDTEV